MDSRLTTDRAADRGAMIRSASDARSSGCSNLHKAENDWRFSLAGRKNAKNRHHDRDSTLNCHQHEVGEVAVRNVPAAVLPDNTLPVGLLGMSFLSKLSRFEVARGELVLKQ
jgi:clan AA aspartic protease (TIGR02281 family)